MDSPEDQPATPPESVTYNSDEEQPQEEEEEDEQSEEGDANFIRAVP